MVKISGGRLAAKNQGNQKAKASVQGGCRAADPLADGLGARPVNSFWKVSRRPYQRVKQVRAVAKACKKPGSLQQPKTEPLSWSRNGARAPPVGGRVAIKKNPAAARELVDSVGWPVIQVLLPVWSRNMKLEDGSGPGLAGSYSTWCYRKLKSWKLQHIISYSCSTGCCEHTVQELKGAAALVGQVHALQQQR